MHQNRLISTLNFENFIRAQLQEIHIEITALYMALPHPTWTNPTHSLPRAPLPQRPGPPCIVRDEIPRCSELITQQSATRGVYVIRFKPGGKWENIGETL